MGDARIGGAAAFATPVRNPFYGAESSAGDSDVGGATHSQYCSK
jgi:hypothetical protein